MEKKPARRQRDAELCRDYRTRMKKDGVPDARTFYASVGQTLIETLLENLESLDLNTRNQLEEILLEAKARLLRSSDTYSKSGISRRVRWLQEAALHAIKARQAIYQIDPDEQKARGTPATWEAYEKSRKRMKRLLRKASLVKKTED